MCDYDFSNAKKKKKVKQGLLAVLGVIIPINMGVCLVIDDFKTFYLINATLYFGIGIWLFVLNCKNMAIMK